MIINPQGKMILEMIEAVIKEVKKATVEPKKPPPKKKRKKVK